MKREDALAALDLGDLLVELRRDWKILATIAVVSLGVHLALWTGWPLYSVRTIGISEINFYVNAFELFQPTDYQLLAYAQPVAPLYYALTLTIGPLATQIAQTVLATLAVMMVYLIARPWGRWAAAAAALLYLIDLPLQLLLHEVNSEGLTLWFFSAILLTLRYALQKPTAMRWAVMGTMVGLAALTRPAMLGFVILAASLTFTNLTLKKKLTLIAVTTTAVILVITPWIVYKGVRFDLWGFTRPNTGLVFYSARYYHLVDPQNGPASDELAALLNDHLISNPLYVQYGISLDEVLNKLSSPGSDADLYGPNKYHHDIVNMVDIYKGWDTNYRLLNQVGAEAISAHPQEYVRSYFESLGVILLNYDSFTIPGPRVYDIFVRAPGQQPAIYRESISHPNNVSDPSTAALEARADRIRQIFGNVIQAHGDAAVASGIISTWETIWPPMALFYVLFLIGLLAHKKLSLSYWLFMSGATAGLIGFSVLAGPLPRYRLPVEPLIIIGAVVGLRYVIDFGAAAVSWGVSRLRTRGASSQDQA